MLPLTPRPTILDQAQVLSSAGFAFQAQPVDLLFLCLRSWHLLPWLPSTPLWVLVGCLFLVSGLDGLILGMIQKEDINNITQ